MYDCNIVVIDGETAALELIESTLESVTSSNIHLFSDGKKALDYVKSDSMDNISLVICDWLMLGVSGIEILVELRKSKPDCPFLMLTANATKEQIVDSIRLGATDFIVKPFLTSDLRTKVERIIRDADLV